MLGSQTQKVLQPTTIPVLVSAVESNRRRTAEMLAPLAIMRDEHRSLAAVIHGLEYVVREARDQGTPPSFPLLRAMRPLRRARFRRSCITRRKTRICFRKLRARTTEYDATLDELERQHVEGHRLIEELARSIDAYEADSASGLPRFAEASQRFATSQMQHMMLETKVIIPAARKHLTDEDWTDIGSGVRTQRRPALLGRRRRGVSASSSPASSTSRRPVCVGATQANATSIRTIIGRRTTMHSRIDSIPPPAPQPSTTAIALATRCSPRPARQAFEIDIGNPDIEMRWDNTFRYNLGGRVQSRTRRSSAAPNNDDGDRNFGKGSLVTNRLDVLSEFDFVWQEELRRARERRRCGTTTPTAASTTPTPRPPTRWSTACRSPGVLAPYTKRYAQGRRRANGSTRSRSPTSSRSACQ